MDTDTINILYISTLVINNIVTSCPNCDGSNMNALLAVTDSSDGCKQVKERKWTSVRQMLNWNSFQHLMWFNRE